MEDKTVADDLIGFYREREKELECLYRIEEILAERGAPCDHIFRKIAEAIPRGWQHPELCCARITIGSDSYHLAGFVETSRALAADILIEGKKGGEILVCYTRRTPEADEGTFLRQEKRLLQTIADRLGAFIRHQKLIEAAGVRRREQSSLYTLYRWYKVHFRFRLPPLPRALPCRSHRTKAYVYVNFLIFSQNNAA